MGANSVKYLHSGMTGAPVLSGSVGALISVLDACLVDGFGLGTLDSLVIASGVATATRASGHPFEAGQVVLIAGATVTGGTVNGEHRVLSTTATTYTFDATGISNQSATGTITHKVSPVGWSKEFSGTNLAAYKSVDGSATGFRLRVDDTGTYDARVVGYETMSDVNTGTGPFPTSAQQSGGGYWVKSSTASAAARSWILVADERTFYLAVSTDGTARYVVWGFGDLIAQGSTDAYCAVLNYYNASGNGVPISSIQPYSLLTANPASNTGIVMPRSYTGVGSSALARKWFSVMTGSTLSNLNSGGTADNGWPPYPNGSDGALYVTPACVSQDSDKSLRGTLPGLWPTPQYNVDASIASKDSVTSVAGLTGRILKAAQCGGNGIGFFDITGPWR